MYDFGLVIDKATKDVSQHQKDKLRSYDFKSFNLYEKGEINLKDCKYRFKLNYRIPQDEYETITDEDFETWIHGLGYYNGLPDIQE